MLTRPLLPSILFAICILSAAFAGAAELSPLETEDLLAQERISIAAILHHDLDFLRKYIAGDAMFTIRGKKYTKRMFLATVVEAPVVNAAVKSRFRDVKTNVAGGVVTLSGVVTTSAFLQGRWQDLLEGRFVERFRRVHGEWVLLGGESLGSRTLLEKR